MLLTIILSAVAVAALGAGAAVAVRRFKKAPIDMDVVEFCRRLVRGRGFRNLSPAQFSRMIEMHGSDSLVIDLRDAKVAGRDPFPRALSKPFDVFLREVVVERAYDAYRNRDVYLLCDSGHMSRVAADILAQDEGFARVANLAGGVKRWRRWKRLGEKTCCRARALLAGTCGC